MSERDKICEALYETTKQMLGNKLKSTKTQTDQACMNDALIYEYQSEGKESFEGEEIKGKAEETLDAKL